MPAVNRRVRSEATRRQAVQNCAALLAIESHKLVKVRSIGGSDAAGDSEVKVRSNLLPCPLLSKIIPQQDLRGPTSCASRLSWQLGKALAAPYQRICTVNYYSEVVASL